MPQTPARSVCLDQRELARLDDADFQKYFGSDQYALENLHDIVYMACFTKCVTKCVMEI